MPYYSLQSAYTPEAWAKLVKNPQDRTEAIRPVIEALGGKVIAGFLAFGCCRIPNSTGFLGTKMERKPESYAGRIPSQDRSRRVLRARTERKRSATFALPTTRD